MKTAKALSKQLFGAKYESASKSLLTAAVLFSALYISEFQIEAAPSVLYLTSTLFTAGIMWQTLAGRQLMETLQGIFMLPFKNRSFVISYVSVLGLHTLITRTLLIWALFFAVSAWSCLETAVSLLCGCMACAVTAAFFHMRRKGHIVLPVLWLSGILAAILLIRKTPAVLVMALLSMAAAVLYLLFADACVFYSSAAAKKPVLYKRQTGNVLIYLTRYLMANKSYLVNSAGLCAVSCFLPLLFREFRGLNMFPIGLAILSLNTPLCTLLSCDPDLEQAVRTLPGQAGRFCKKYCLFLFTANGIVSSIYLCSWQLFNNGIDPSNISMVVLFSLQSAVLSVILEWKCPLRSWKTESDLWHHPRKYLVPLTMLAAAAFVSTWPLLLWIWAAVLLIECCVLSFAARR